MTSKTASLITIVTLSAISAAFSEKKAQQGANAVAHAQAKAVLRKEMVSFLGVYAVPLHPVVAKQLNLSKGLYLSTEQVVPDSPAEKAGLEQYDVLMKFDDQILVNPEQLQALVHSRKKGDQVKISILRGGKQETIEVQLDEQKVPDVAFGRALPVPAPADPRFGFGGQGFPFGPDADINARAFKFRLDDLDGNLDLRFGLGDDVRAQIQRQMQRHRDQLGKQGFGHNQKFNDPELLEKYDADGDGKLSPMERDKARSEGAIPNSKFDFDLDLDFNLGAPKVEDLLRDARRRGTASSWSSVSGSAQTKIMTMDDTGSYEFSSNDGDKRFKATGPNGDLLFDGPVNTKEERSKVPENLRQRLDSIESNVKVRIHADGLDHELPQVQPDRKNKKGKGKKNQLL